MNKPPLIALAGNPNVGKSTVFNALTGLRQHTGNWPGKTVSAARGTCVLDGQKIALIDTPGAYSLWAQSAEEEAALEALCFGGADAVIAVCDAGCLERNLNLVYQVMEITDRVVVCVNLMDEARKKGIAVDLKALSRHLGVPVIGACARQGKGIRELLAAAVNAAAFPPTPRGVRYPQPVEQAADSLAQRLSSRLSGRVNARFAALRLMQGDPCFRRELERRNLLDPRADAAADAALFSAALTREAFSALAIESIFRAAEDACGKAVTAVPDRQDRSLQADRLLTGPLGIPVMVSLLALILFLTVKGANVPSAWLGESFSRLESVLARLLSALHMPPFWRALLTEGMFRTLGQVVSVMLPPMAIFFPLFTLLEDSGYLPRAAFMMDGLFERCRACGKQALTMCMGLGCNAVGVTGCRIIDSPRERLIAILTNSLTPCNGRFPTLIAMTALFFSGGGPGGAAVSLAVLAGICALSVGMTLLISRLLSATALRGVPSFFSLELPPYRMPQAGRVLVRSALDRVVFVLGRAAAVAAPAGLVIFVLSHISLAGEPLLIRFSGLLDPLGRLMGLDGAILTGFLLGFPANETVLPIILMVYAAGGEPGNAADLYRLGDALRQHGWTALTALNTMLLCLFHFPCSTTMITIYKETKSRKWTLTAFLLPVLTGAVLCMLTTLVSSLLR